MRELSSQGPRACSFRARQRASSPLDLLPSRHRRLLLVAIDGASRANLRAESAYHIPMRRGFVYLTVVLDWASQWVLARRFVCRSAWRPTPRSRRWRRPSPATACRSS